MVLGIGGGGDVVGALAAARRCEALGTPFALGGVTWERFVVDPRPGPRPLSEIEGGRQIGEGALLAGPDTRTLDGIAFSESRMAQHLGTPTALIDVSAGPRVAAAGMAAAMAALDCDLCLCVDVGGDILAHGDEPGLASPLCDAVMLAAAGRLAADGAATLLAIVGPGCDGELTQVEVLTRIAGVARAGGWIGTWSLGPTDAAALEAAAAVVPTEASLQVARCARGETGQSVIRQGRRRVELGPLGALILVCDLPIALRSEAPLARALADAGDVEDARRILAELGVRSELDYERSRARQVP